MKLSRTVGYALQATLILAEGDPSQPIPCSRIAAQGHMPERFLLQILRSLVTSGILNSTRGVDGGYSLKRAANEITLLDLIEAVDGPISPHSPPTDGLSSEARNHLARALEEVTAASRRQLASIKLSSLAPQRRKAV